MKKEVRIKYRKIRKNIIGKETKDSLVFNNLLTKVDFNKYNQILIYVSNSEEVDTLKIISYFISNKKIAVPKIENGIMNFYYIKDTSELAPGYFNILEPITNDIVTDYYNSICITPGICFSKEGYRIGYGGGFYDRFLTNNKVYAVGLCYKECLVEKIETDKFDKKVDLVITD